MRRLLELILLTSLSLSLTAQDKLFSLGEDLFDLEADHLGNLYLLHADQLIKTDQEGNEIARFSRPDLGMPEIINVYDPMRVLLHYPEFNQVVVLDNRLNLRFPPVELFSLGFVDVPCVALADENFLWLYDQVKDQLVKLDMRRMQIVFRTPPLTQLLERETEPLLMRSNVRGVFFLMKEGLARFDAMGNWMGFIPASDIDDLHIVDDAWTFSRKGQITRANGYTAQGMSVNSTMEFIHWTTDGQRVYLSDGKSIAVTPLLR